MKDWKRSDEKSIRVWIVWLKDGASVRPELWFKERFKGLPRHSSGSLYWPEDEAKDGMVLGFRRLVRAERYFSVEKANDKYPFSPKRGPD